MIAGVVLALIVACVSAQESSLNASCSNHLFDQDETDVDCGGVCEPCGEELKCIVDEDCSGVAPGCTGTQCFDMSLAQQDMQIFVVYIGAMIALLLAHVLYDYCKKVKGHKSVKLRQKKKHTAEETRVAAETDRQAKEFAERSKRRQSAMKKAALAKSKDEADSDSTDSEDEWQGAKSVATRSPEASSEKETAPTSSGKSKLWSKVTVAKVKGMMIAQGSNEHKSEISAKVDVESGPGEKTDTVKRANVPEGAATGFGLVRMASLVEAARIHHKRTKEQEKAQARSKRKQERAARAGELADPSAEALRLRDLFLFPLVELSYNSKDFVGRIREDAAIVNVNKRLLKEERETAVTKLRIVALSMLKPGAFVNMKMDDVKHCVMETERAEGLIEQVLQGDGMSPDSDIHKLQEAVDICEEVAAQVGSPLETDYFANATEVMGWEMGDPQLVELQRAVEESLESKKQKRVFERQRLALAASNFVDASSGLTDAVKFRNRWRRRFLKVVRFAVPRFIRQFPFFYFAFYTGMVLAGLPFFAKVGTLNSNKELQNTGLLGSTFLPVPGYYNLDEKRAQRTLIPLLYGFMHMALYCFCWMPVSFYRGTWRTVSGFMPRLREFTPLDDLIWFHKLVAMQAFTFIITGAVCWIAALYAPCGENDARSCQAFDPLPPPGLGIDKNLFAVNPFQNVLVLRKIVFLLWFPVMPLLHWARGSPPKFLPSFVKQYMWEIAFYAHITVAYVSLAIALISRFDVFYPSAITWGIYLLDLAHEAILNTHETYVVIKPSLTSMEDADDAYSTLVHTDDKGQPTSIKLLMDVPPGFRMTAGQVVYLQVPSISRVQWHPFSLASGSRSDYVELQIGVVGAPDQWTKSDKDGEFRMTQRPTFTYLFQDAIRRRIKELAFKDDPERQVDEIEQIKVKLRGPYGSSFTKCFDPHYGGVVIIGAGTGLTAALSVLRELIARKKRGDRCPKYCWFVWSCARVSDLLWVWDTLHELLLSALKVDVLKPGPKWNRSSSMLGWLGVTIYVTRGDRKLLAEFVNRPIVNHENGLRQVVRKVEKFTSREAQKEADELKKAAEIVLENDQAGKRRSNRLSKLRGLWQSTNLQVKKVSLSGELHHWMGHDRRLLPASMDDEATHVSKLLAWSRVYLDRKMGKSRKLAVCFCGPAALAHTVADAAADIGSGMEFSADHQ